MKDYSHGAEGILDSIGLDKNEVDQFSNDVFEKIAPSDLKEGDAIALLYSVIVEDIEKKLLESPEARRVCAFVVMRYYVDKLTDIGVLGAIPMSEVRDNHIIKNMN